MWGAAAAARLTGGMRMTFESTSGAAQIVCTSNLHYEQWCYTLKVSVFVLPSARTSADCRDAVMRRRRALAAAEAAAVAAVSAAEALEAMAAQAVAEGGPENEFNSEQLLQRARVFRGDV